MAEDWVWTLSNAVVTARPWDHFAATVRDPRWSHVILFMPRVPWDWNDSPAQDCLDDMPANIIWHTVPHVVQIRTQGVFSGYGRWSLPAGFVTDSVELQNGGVSHGI